MLKDKDEVELAKKIIELVNIDKNRFGVSFSMDCTSNIFKDKEILVKKLLYLQNTLKSADIDFGYDHKMPSCFLYGTGLDIENEPHGICDVSTSGVIDADLTLQFCLQNSGKIIKIYENGKFISWQFLMNQLYKKFYELRLMSLNKICSECRFFNVTCNGGCWIPKENITKKDIIENSDKNFWINAKEEN